MAELPENYKERWEHFVNDALAETNKRNTADLVRSDTTNRIVGFNNSGDIVFNSLFSLAVYVL